MVLVDTSVWVDHLRRGNDDLVTLLEEARSLCHPFVIGELACGNLSQRDRILSLLGALPQAPVAEHAEVLELVESRRLHGQGLGWIDMHLLASALLAGCPLWTLDRRLASAARKLGRGSDVTRGGVASHSGPFPPPPRVPAVEHPNLVCPLARPSLNTR